MSLEELAHLAQSAKERCAAECVDPGNVVVVGADYNSQWPVEQTVLDTARRLFQLRAIPQDEPHT